MAKLCGVVLAGGQSRRMGSDKACLAWGEKRFIDRAVESLGTICSEGVWVGGRDYGYPYFADLAGLKGPMASIGALPSLETNAEFFVILPVDMPHVDARMLEEVATEVRGQTSDVDCVCVVGSHFPIFLRRSENIFDNLRATLSGPIAEGSPSIRAFLERLRCLRLDVDAPFLVNINDPAAYAKALKQFGGVTP